MRSKFKPCECKFGKESWCEGEFGASSMKLEHIFVKTLTCDSGIELYNDKEEDQGQHCSNNSK